MDTGIQNNIKQVLKSNTIVVIPDDADAKKRRKKYNKKIVQENEKKIKEIQKKQKETKEKQSPKEFKSINLDYIGEDDAFECPKTKEFIKIC